jgi:integrase
MPSTKLTVKSIKDITVTDGKSILVMDTELPGFGVKVTASGKKSYIFQYRLGGRAHSTQRLKIGDVSEDLPATKAREEALQLRSKVRRGIDPQLEKRRQAANTLRKKACTFKSAFEEYFQTRLQQNRRGSEVKAVIEKEFSRFLPLPLEEIERADISYVVNGICSRGAPYAANRSLSYVKTFFRWSVGTGLLTIDPTYAMPKPFAGETSRDRVLTADEIKFLWGAWTILGRPFGDALKVLLLTAQRRDEVGGMRWNDLDLEANIWSIPRDFTKNKNPHQVPIMPLVKTILLGQPMIGEFVFSSNGKSHISGWSKMKVIIEESLTESKHPMENWRFHDLRRTAASNLGDLEYSDAEIGLLLNHQSRGVTSIYNRSNNMIQKKEMLKRWEEKLKAVLTG